MPPFDTAGLQIRLIQRNLMPHNTPDKTPTLLLLESMYRHNLECQRQLVQLLASDSITVEELEKQGKATRSVEQYHVALLGCIKALQRFPCRDERLYRLLANHTTGLLTSLETDKLTQPKKWLYGKLITEALQLLPEESLSAFPRLARQRTWPNELPEKPRREQILKELDELISLRKYDACCQMMLHLAQADYQALVTAISRLLKAGALNQATQLARLLKSRYELNPDCVESDFRNWEEGEATACAIQRVTPLPAFIHLVSKLCAEKCTQERLVNHLLNPLDMEGILQACAPFPPAITTVIDHLLNQQLPDRVSLMRIVDHLIKLDLKWLDTSLQDSAMRLIRYFANAPFQREDAFECSSAKALFSLATILPNTTQALHLALDASSEVMGGEEKSIYHDVLIALSSLRNQGVPDREIVHMWQRSYPSLPRVDFPAIHNTWSQLPNSSFRPLFEAALTLANCEPLPSEWWPVIYTALYGLLKEIAAGSLPRDNGSSILMQIQKVMVQWVNTSLHQPYDLYIPLLFKVAMDGEALENYGHPPVEWARPIVEAMTIHKGPWCLTQLLDLLRTSPNSAVSYNLLPHIAISSLEDPKRRFVLHRRSSSPLPKDHIERMLREEIASSPSFIEDPSFTWAAYSLLYQNQPLLSDRAFLQIHLNWVMRLLESGSDVHQAIGFGVYAALHRSIRNHNLFSQEDLEHIMKARGLSGTILEEAHAQMKRDAYLARLTQVAYQRLLAMEISSLHGINLELHQTQAQEMASITVECHHMRSLIKKDETILLGWLNTIPIILARARILAYSRVDIYSRIKAALSLIKAKEPGIEPYERALLGYHLLEAVATAPLLLKSMRSELLQEIMEPECHALLFADYPELKLYLLNRIFTAYSKPLDHTTYSILSKECFRLIGSSRVGVPAHVRDETLSKWLTWSKAMTEEITISDIETYINSGYREGNLTQVECQNLLSSLSP